MARKIDWESQIGRRLKLRDLHVFSTVVQHGSMAKAAQHLGVSQPSVSEVIADLEHALGVRLLDRSAQGVELTIYGGALLKRSVVVFDELKQSIRDIEFLSDATTGEVRIACTQSVEYTLLPEIILRFSEQYPRVEVYADLIGNSKEFSGLRERNMTASSSACRRRSSKRPGSTIWTWSSCWTRQRLLRQGPPAPGHIAGRSISPN